MNGSLFPTHIKSPALIKPGEHTMGKPTIRLGKEVFYISSEGDIVQTMVAKIFDDGQYLFLDGTCNKHWFTYEEAAVAAVQLALEKEKKLRQRLMTLRRKRKQLLTTTQAGAASMSGPFKVVDLSGAECRSRTRKLKRISVPAEYPQLGTMVYVAVTSNIWTGEFEYRPYPSFILEVPISSVWFTPDGAYHVRLSNSYGIDKYFPTREAAKAEHSGISIVVPYEEYKEGRKEFERELGPPF